MSSLALPAELARRAHSGALTHAWILAGAAEERLEELAAGLAAAFLCGGAEKDIHPDVQRVDQPRALQAAALLRDGEGSRPCGTCKHCRKVEKGIHPDVQWVEKPADKAQISVDQIRALRADAYIRPNEAARKVYIIKEASRLTDEAQNAFLKVLEEGPAYAAFILLSANHQALLPTVRSRCEIFRCAGQSGGTDAEAARKGGELAGLLLREDRWRLISWCMAYEKAKREEVLPIWEAARQALLTYRRQETTAKAVRLAQTLAEIIAAGERNGNIGALWGKLWAAC